MALVTIQRSPSPSTDPELDGVDSTEDASEGRSQIRKRSKTSKEKLRKIFSTVRFISKLRPCLSECYFTVKGAALILPHNECTKKNSKKSHGGEIQSHLQAMLHLLRPEDTIKIAVRLEDANSWNRYMALVSTRGRQDTEEAVILGIDCTISEASIGLVLPVWMGLKIKLGGDGGFSLCTDEQHYLFKPVSVQAMWSAIQSLVKVMNVAEDMKYIHDGLTHTWVGYYKSHVDRRGAAGALPWNVEGVEVFAPSSLSLKTDNEDNVVKQAISQKLKQVMMTVDLDEATSIMLRKKVEEGLGMSLIEFKSYFDEEVMRILGQMDEPSKILDYLYLGSEWNASNLEELNNKGIGYILNVTREIDNFFVGKFQYYNVRVMDVEEEELLRHWDKTYKFIAKARSHHSKVLVHCKMGVSRSASTVMAYLMKENRWTVAEAFDFVKERRSCVNPNSGFMAQLTMYQGILTASNQREIFRCKSNQNLLEENSSENTDIGQGSFLGTSLFTMMSHADWPLASGGVALKEEWCRVNPNTEDYSVETELEVAESRSADSVEDVATETDASSPEEMFSLAADTLPDCPSLQEPSSEVSSLKLFSDYQMSPDAETVSSDFPLLSCGSLGSRIKPDRSWIRLDAGCDKPDNCKMDDDSTLDTGLKTFACFNTQDSGQIGAVCVDNDCTNQPLDLTQVAGKIVADSLISKWDSSYKPARFSIGEVQLVTAETAQSVPYTALPLCSAAQETSMEDLTVIRPASVSSDYLLSADVNILMHSGDKMWTSGSGDKPGLNEQLTKKISGVEIIANQCFLKENIPWNIGKVQKIKEDYNKTGQILQGLNISKMDLKSPVQEYVEFKANDLNDDHNLLDRAAHHQHPITLSQSHSCMELSTMTSLEPGHMTLYEREEIPLEPGTVRRTKQEIEDRQRVSSGDTDEEPNHSPRRVQRSSSLKQEGEAKSKIKSNRRLTGSPELSAICGKSLNDLSRLEVADAQVTTFGASATSKMMFGASTTLIQPETYLPPEDNPVIQSEVTLLMFGNEATPIKSGLVRKQKLELEGKCEPDRGQCKILISPDSDVTPPCDSSIKDQAKHILELQAKAEDIPAAKNLDPQMLALIREIGSALQTNPTSLKSAEKDEELYTNKVKYLVRRIEKTNTALNVEAEGDGEKNDGLHSKEPVRPQVASDCWQKCPAASVSQVVHVQKTDRPDCMSPNSDKDSSQKTSNQVSSSFDVCKSDPINIASSVAPAGGLASSSFPRGNSPRLPDNLYFEPSVVRHLVGKFECQTPDTDHSGDMNFEAGARASSEQFSSMAMSAPTSSRSLNGSRATSVDTPYSPTLLSSSKRQISLDSSSFPQNTPKESSSPYDINVELYEYSTDPMVSRGGRPSFFDRPIPFSPVNLRSSENRTWRSVTRPSSAECSDYDSSSLSSDRSKVRRSLGNEECPVAEEGRKIRRLHGKTHPLTKLSEQPKGPFYSSM